MYAVSSVGRATLGYTLSIGTLLVQILSGFLMLTSARAKATTSVR